MKQKRVLKSDSGHIASSRAAMTISADRLSCSVQSVMNLKQELIDLLRKYIIFDNDIQKIQLELVFESKQGVQDVKTIQIK